MCEQHEHEEAGEAQDQGLTRREFLSTTGKTSAALGAVAIGLSGDEAAAGEPPPGSDEGAKLPEGVVALDELELVVVVDNETDTLSSVDDGVPQTPEVVRRIEIVKRCI